MLDEQNESKPKPDGRAPRGTNGGGIETTVRTGDALTLGPLDGNIGFHLRLAGIEAERAMKARWGEEFRLGYFPVLMLIRLNPGATQTAIAEAVGLRRSSLVPILKQLERFGWIERTGHEGDRRANRIRLTPEGRAASDALEREVAQVENAAREALGADGHKRMVEFLKAVEGVFSGLGA